MPTVQLPLVSFEELISEPIKRQIIARIGGDVHYINSTGNKLTNSDGIDLDNKDEARVTISEGDFEDSAISNTLTSLSYRHVVMEDKEIGLSLKFADIDREYTISISKRFSTRGEAIAWRNKLMGNLRDGTFNQTTDIAVAPCISNKVLTVVDECRKRKVLATGENVDFVPYLLDISIDTISMDTNAIGSDVAITFPELMENLVFSLPSRMPEPSLDSGKYLLDFDIQTIIKVPVSSLLTYPNFVGGKRLPKLLVDTSIDVNMDVANRGSGSVLAGLVNWQGETTSHYRKYCYQLPAFEDYQFPFRKWGLTPLFQLRTAPSPEDTRLIINLNDIFNVSLAGYSIDPSILDYMVENKEVAAKPNDAAVAVVLMKGGDMVTPNLLYVDDYMCLRAKYDLDPLGDYHLVLVTHDSIVSMSENIFNTVKESQPLLNRLIKHCHPEVNYDALPTDSVVTIEKYRPIFEEIEKNKGITNSVTANVLVVNTKYAN